MIKKQTIESTLHCKATAELAQSVNEDLLKSDGSLKDLLNDEIASEPSGCETNSSDRGSEQH